jgi:hypothetical protein
MGVCKICGFETGSRRVICKQCELKICKEYVEDGKSLRWVSKTYNIADSTVKRSLNENGFKTRNYSESQIGRKHPPEVKHKIGKGNRGKFVSEETKKKISENVKKAMTKEICKKISLAREGKFFGKSNPNWRGGRLGWLQRNGRFIVKLRDNFCCQDCGMTEWEELQLRGRVLAVHHIDGNHDNDALDNLITLCNSCHTKLHGLKRRTKNAKKKST